MMVVVAFWTTIASAQDAGSSLAPGESARLYGALPANGRLDLSPDGRYLAREVVHDGRHVLRIDDLEGGGAKLWKPADGASLGRFAWTGDGTLLVVSEKLAVSRRRSRDPRAGRSKLYYAFFQEQRPQVLTPDARPVARMTFRRLGQIKAFSLLSEPELTSGALPVFVDTENAGRYGEVFRPAVVDLSTGHAAFGAPPVEARGFYSYWGSPDGGTQLARHADEAGAVRYYLRHAEGRWQGLPRSALEGMDVLAVVGPDRILVRVPEKGVFAYDPVSASRGEAIYEGSATGLVWSDDRRSVVGVWTRSGVVFLDERAETAHREATAALGSPARPVDASHDGRVRIIATGGAEPTTYHLLRDGTVVDSFPTYPQIAARSPALVRTLSYAARDGLTIEAFLSAPPNADPADLPLLVMPHGGPATHDTADFDAWREHFVAIGFAVFQPNFRGSTGYGDAFRDAGRRGWGTSMQADIVDGVRHLAANGLADEARAVILGASYGGYAALMGTLDETPYRCAVAINGVSDLLGMIGAEQTGTAFAYWTDHIGYGALDDTELMRRSPLRRTGEIDVPVLLIHAVLDTTVLKGQSAAMERALREAGGEVEAIYLDESDHYLPVQTERIRALSEAATFLKACVAD